MCVSRNKGAAALQVELVYTEDAVPRATPLVQAELHPSAVALHPDHFFYPESMLASRRFGRHHLVT